MGIFWDGFERIFGLVEKLYPFLHKRILKRRYGTELGYRAFRGFLYIKMGIPRNLKRSWYQWCSERKEFVQKCSWIVLILFIVLSVPLLKAKFFGVQWFLKTWAFSFFLLPALFVDLKKKHPDYYYWFSVLLIPSVRLTTFFGIAGFLKLTPFDGWLTAAIVSTDLTYALSKIKPKYKSVDMKNWEVALFLTMVVTSTQVFLGFMPVVLQELWAIIIGFFLIWFICRVVKTELLVMFRQTQTFLTDMSSLLGFAIGAPILVTIQLFRLLRLMKQQKADQSNGK